MSMRQMLAMLVVATAVPLVALAFVMLQQLIAYERQATRDGLLSNTRSLGILVDNEIDTHIAVAATLATSLALESGDLGTFKTQAERALTVAPGPWVNLFDPAGHLLMTTLPGLSLTQPRVKTKLDAIAKAFATGKPQVSDVEPGLFTNRPNVVIEYPVFRAGVPQYSIELGLNPDRFLELLRDKFGATSLVGILDRQHMLVARVPDHDARVGTPASDGWRAAIDRAPLGFAEIDSLEGVRTLTAYVPTRDGWTAGIGYPLALLDAPMRRILWTMGLLGAVLTLASLALAISLGRRMSRAMSGLVIAAQKVGLGEIVARKQFPIHEATAISQALSAASVDRRQAEEYLRESEARFRGTFDNTAVGVAHVSLGGAFLEVNQRLCEILGYSAVELAARTFQELTHPEDLAADLENLRKLRAAELQAYTMDKRYIRKDGSIVWTGLTVSLHRATTGSPNYFIKIVRDITERKQAQDDLQFLLHEIAHRSKNQLAVVEAIARQTARSATSLGDFQQSFGQRVQGLAVSINMLVAENWTGAALGDLVHRQLQTFEPGDARLECEGPGVTVSADAAQAIGLALHELATNSVKHGAWSTPAGIVTVSWLLERNGSEKPRLRLRWQERGGPVVKPPTRKGFGHMVIDTMIAQKLDAVVDMAFDPQGLRWTVTIPSSHSAATSWGADLPRGKTID